MTQLAIASADALRLAFETWKPDAVVTVHKPTTRVLPLTGVRHLRLAFHDVERAVKPGIHRAQAMHVAALLNLIDDKPERLLIQCTAGLSRSPALAIIAAVRLGASVVDACQAMRAAVPHASPNRWVLRVGDHALGLDGALTGYASSAFEFRRTAYGVLGHRAGFAILSELTKSQGSPRAAGTSKGPDTGGRENATGCVTASEATANHLAGSFQPGDGLRVTRDRRPSLRPKFQNHLTLNAKRSRHDNHYQG